MTDRKDLIQAYEHLSKGECVLDRKFTSDSKVLALGLAFVILAIVLMFSMNIFKDKQTNSFSLLSFTPVSLANIEVINKNEFTVATSVAMHHDFGIAPDKTFYPVLNVVEGRLLEDTLKSVFPLVGNESPYLLLAEITNFNTESDKASYTSKLSVLYNISDANNGKTLFKCEVLTSLNKKFGDITNVVSARRDLVKINVENFLNQLAEFKLDKNKK